jgi:hypothetical protein
VIGATWTLDFDRVGLEWYHLWRQCQVQMKILEGVELWAPQFALALFLPRCERVVVVVGKMTDT